MICVYPDEEVLYWSKDLLLPMSLVFSNSVILCNTYITNLSCSNQGHALLNIVVVRIEIGPAPWPSLSFNHYLVQTLSKQHWLAVIDVLAKSLKKHTYALSFLSH